MERSLSQVPEEILKIVSQLKPDLKPARDLLDCGCGFAAVSFFSFTKEKSLWIVILCNGNFAYKEVSPEWVSCYSNLVLSSPQVFVDYDITHRITAWAVAQEKFCNDAIPETGKMVRAI